MSRKKTFDAKLKEESSDDISDEDPGSSDEESARSEEDEGSNSEPPSGSGSEDQSEDEESEVDEDQSEDEESEVDEDQSEDEESEVDEDQSEDEESDVDEDNPLRRGRDAETGIQIMSNLNLRSEIDKGICVKNQMKFWESFLEVRIKLQKCLANSNKMPQYDVHKQFKSDSEFNKTTGEVTSNLTQVLEKLLKLQSTLLKNFPETKNILSNNKKRKAEDDVENQSDDDPMNEEIPSDTEDELENEVEEHSEEDDSKQSPKKKMKLEDFEKVIAQNHKAYCQYRNSVIQKWNDKTRISSGNVNKASQNQPVVKQIEFILSDKEKLLNRTRVRRSEYEIVGKTVSDELNEDGRHVQEYDPEIFDDDDFYHQLLRELIEHKAAGITDPIQLSRQWIQLQNMRHKLKRKIDTRATKGRRIRYGVHQKLVNFMAPFDIFDTWSDNAKNELYNSLFGKMYSSVEEKSINE